MFSKRNDITYNMMSFYLLQIFRSTIATEMQCDKQNNLPHKRQRPARAVAHSGSALTGLLFILFEALLDFLRPSDLHQLWCCERELRRVLLPVLVRLKIQALEERERTLQRKVGQTFITN